MTVADRYMPGWTGDGIFTPSLNWKDNWDLKLLNRKRKEPFNERFVDLMEKRERAFKAGDRKKVSEIDRRLEATKRRKEERAINTLYRNLCKWEIDYKVKDGYTFGIERRKCKKTGTVYNGYLCRQKRIDGKKEHIYLGAKSLKDYRENVLWSWAQKEVYGDKWVLKDLTPSEINTFKVIERETRYYKKNDRDPIVERYRKQLGMKCSRNKRRTPRGYLMHTTVEFQPIHEKKRILQAARKAFGKQKGVDRKIDKIGMNVAQSGFNQDHRCIFVDSLITESKCGRSVEALKNYINLQKEMNPNSVYSILKACDVGIFAARVMWFHKKPERWN